MNQITGNKGEWSELYALLHIFTERGILAADKHLNPTTKKYIFLQVIREDEPNTPRTYDLTNKNIVKILDKSNAEIKSISTTDLPQKAQNILRKILESNARTFTIAEAPAIMNDFLLTRLKAASSSKSDITAIIKDHIIERSDPIGFSIKSQLGGASTLLNASNQTNFTFHVNGLSDGDITNINAINSKCKIRDRIKHIHELGGSLTFSHIPSPTFTTNLRIIDTAMPQILAQILLDYSAGVATEIPALSTHYATANPFDLGEIEVASKLRSLLRAVALGMTPSKPWNDRLSAYGGYIIVRNDGLPLCYHLYNDDEFRDYLFTNTKLDTPSTSRYNSGTIYMDKNRPTINLTLQVRFTK